MVRRNSMGDLGDNWIETYGPGSDTKKKQLDKAHEAWPPGTCRAHPKYKGVHKPNMDCPQCWIIYKEKHK